MKRIGLIKRLLVIIYDGLLLFSVAAFSSALWMALFIWLAPDSFFVDPATLENPKIVELTDLGNAIGGIIVSLNVLAVSFLFYGWFWTHGGQTLGMKAWNLYLVKPDGKFIDWPLAAKRYSLALLSWLCLGLGFLWILGHPKRKAWHDLFSNTQIIYHKETAQSPKKTK